MKKITFIGAGSFGFTRTLARDLLTFPAFSDCQITLMDIDAVRLEKIRLAVEKIIAAGQYKATVKATMDRREALRDADGVLITILQGGLPVWRRDLEIPEKYGVKINVGDTRGPAGIFRALRTLPVMLDICKDIEECCPNALVLNYTNPMAILCRAMQGHTNVNVTGLCHSVQGTAEMLARWIGAPMEEIDYLCAGINHQAFYLDYRWKGKDAYPLIKEAVKTRSEVYEEEIVRNEMLLHLGYYVTESSGHNSEYNSWFRKRPDLIEKYCDKGTSWNPGETNFLIDYYLKRENTWEKEIDDWMANEETDLNRSHEYAAYIFNAVFGDNTLFRFNGNVRNFGLIDNLPAGCCVEVPVLASTRGLEPIHAGALPDHLAVLVNTNARCEELVVQGAMEGDRDKIFYAVCNDPLTSAVLSLEEARNMTDEMFEANKEYLTNFR